MAEPNTAIDITNMPDLLGIIDEIRAGKKPRVLRRHGENAAVVVPLTHTSPKRRRGRKKTDTDYEAFRSAAGRQNLVPVKRQRP